MEKHQHPRPFLSHRTLRFVLTNCLVAFIAAGTSLGAPAALRAGAPLAPDKSLARQVALDPVITKSVSQATANIGDVLTFTLTVSNPLPFAVVYFGPVDSVSPTLSILSGTPGYVITGTTIGWNPASGSPAPLASLATATYTFTAQVKDCGDILNAASFTWRRDGTNQGNVVDSNVVGVKVNCAPQFVATKEVNQVTAAISNTIQWTIRVTNTGSLTGTYFGPVDNLPANVTFQSATPGYIGPNPLIWNTSGTALGPGATDVYTIAVHVDGPCGKPIENRAFIKTQGRELPR